MRKCKPHITVAIVQAVSRITAANRFAILSKMWQQQQRSVSVVAATFCVNSSIPCHKQDASAINFTALICIKWEEKIRCGIPHFQLQLNLTKTLKLTALLKVYCNNISVRVSFWCIRRWRSFAIPLPPSMKFSKTIDDKELLWILAFRSQIQTWSSLI